MSSEKLKQRPCQCNVTDISFTNKKNIDKYPSWEITENVKQINALYIYYLIIIIRDDKCI